MRHVSRFNTDQNLGTSSTNTRNVGQLSVRKCRGLKRHGGTPKVGTAVAQWLRYCATNRKVAGSITDGVIGIFH